MKSIVPIVVAFLFLVPSLVSFSTATTDGTVTITIKSGYHINNQQQIKGIVGHTIFISNSGTKNLSVNSTTVYYSMFSHKIFGYYNTSGFLPPKLGYSFSDILFLTLHPLFRITVRATVDSSTNLTLERQGFVLFSAFVIFTTGPSSVTGPS